MIKRVPKTPEEAERHNKVVREQAPMHIQKMIDEVETAVRSESKNLDERLEGENRLRNWAKELCGVALDISEIEELRDHLVKMFPSQTLTFVSKRGGPIILYKTHFGTVDRLDRYIFNLEKTIIDLHENKSPIPLNFVHIGIIKFTDLTLLDLIKLIFKKLFLRRV